MNAVKYFVLENKQNKMRHIVWIILLLNGWFMIKIDSILMWIIFMNVMVMILQGANFLYKQKSTAGFVNMLPCNDKDRVMGRYMSGGVYLVTGSIIQLVLPVIYNMTEKETINFNANSIAIGLSCGLVLMAVYSNLLYMAECGNKNLKSILVILPLVLIWAMMPVSISYEIDEGGNLINTLAGFVNENITMVTIVALVVGILSYWLSMKVAMKIVENIDFA